jgi:hypothetical protein
MKGEAAMRHPGREFKIRLRPGTAERLAAEHAAERQAGKADLRRRCREAYERDRVTIGEEYARAMWIDWEEEQP